MIAMAVKPKTKTMIMVLRVSSSILISMLTACCRVERSYYIYREDREEERKKRRVAMRSANKSSKATVVSLFAAWKTGLLDECHVRGLTDQLTVLF